MTRIFNSLKNQTRLAILTMKSEPRLILVVGFPRRVASVIRPFFFTDSQFPKH